MLQKNPQRETDKHRLRKHKYINGETLIYVCEDAACQFPGEDFSEALKQIKR